MASDNRTSTLLQYSDYAHSIFMPIIEEYHKSKSASLARETKATSLGSWHCRQNTCMNLESLSLYVPYALSDVQS